MRYITIYNICFALFLGLSQCNTPSEKDSSPSLNITQTETDEKPIQQTTNEVPHNKVMNKESSPSEKIPAVLPRVKQMKQERPSHINIKKEQPSSLKKTAPITPEDTTPPYISKFAIKGNKILSTGMSTRIFVKANEPLQAPPDIKLNGKSSLQLIKGNNRRGYTFKYKTPADEEEGPSTLTIMLQDKHGNMSNPQEFQGPSIDLTGPEVLKQSIQYPQQISSGKKIQLQFTLSEKTRFSPRVDLLSPEGKVVAKLYHKKTNQRSSNTFSYGKRLKKLPDGLYKIRMHPTKDLLGNKGSESILGEVKIDNPPRLFRKSVSLSSKNLGSNQTLHVHFKVSEALASIPEVMLFHKGRQIATMESLEQKPNGVLQYQLKTTSQLPNGTISLRTTLHDTSGNATTNINLGTFYFDSKAPDIVKDTIIHDDLARPGQKITTTFSVTENLSHNPKIHLVSNSGETVGEFNFDKKQDNNYTFSHNIDQHLQGTYQIQIVSLRDNTGNTKQRLLLGEIQIDGQPPQFLSQPTLSGKSLVRKNDQLTIHLETDEPMEAIAQITWHNRQIFFSKTNELTTTGDFTYRFTGKEPQGTAKVTVIAKDALGNQSQPIDLGTITSDFTPPKLRLLIQPQKKPARPGDRVIITVTSNEPLQPDSIELDTSGILFDGPDINKNSYTWVHAVEAGEVSKASISITAADLAGNRIVKPIIGKMNIDGTLKPTEGYIAATQHMAVLQSVGVDKIPEKKDQQPPIDKEKSIIPIKLPEEIPTTVQPDIISGKPEVIDETIVETQLSMPVDSTNPTKLHTMESHEGDSGTSTIETETPTISPDKAPQPSAEEDIEIKETQEKLVAKPIRVVVYELSANELDPKQVNLVSESLLVELRKLERISASGMREMKALMSIEEQKQILGCESGDSSCIANIAGALGADVLVLGSIGRIGSSTIMNVKRVDMQTTEVEQTYSKRMSGGSGEELLESVAPAIETIFPEYTLRPGMQRGVADELVARWNPPPLKPWWFWTVGALAGAAFATSAVYFIQQQNALSDYEQLVDLSITQPQHGSSLREAEARVSSNTTGARTSLAIGGALAVGAAILGIFFTDWAKPLEHNVGVSVGQTPHGTNVFGLQASF